MGTTLAPVNIKSLNSPMTSIQQYEPQLRAQFSMNITNSQNKVTKIKVSRDEPIINEAKIDPPMKRAKISKTDRILATLRAEMPIFL